MKKRIVKATDLLVVILITALLLFRISLAPFPIRPVSGEHEQRSALPTALRYVAEEAFEGTVLTAVSFGAELKYIGERAFAGSDSLGKAFIPPSAEYIADSAFPYSVMIYGVKGSYAQSWAEESGHAFVAEDIWSIQRTASGLGPETLLALFWVIPPVDEKALSGLKKRIRLPVRSMRPQDRPELYPIQYRFP